MKIYCAHPICGRPLEEILTYYTATVNSLSNMGYDVLHPLAGIRDTDVRNAVKFRDHGKGNVLSSNHTITRRDLWMVRSADIVYVNLIGAGKVSIGSVAELTTGFNFGKHTIAVMEAHNIHRHAFVLEMADIIFESKEDAEMYLESFIKNH